MSAECLSQIGQAARDRGVSENSKFRQILGLKAVHYLAFFILVYVGVEVTIGSACEIHLTVCLHDGIDVQ
jgi:fucose permease